MSKFKIIFLLFFVLTGIKSYSQNENPGGSPYSLFGIGDISYYSSTRTYTMGIVGTSLFGNYVNNFNPAAVTKINSTIISTNFNYGFLKSSNGTEQNKISNGNVLGINIGIPFDQARGWVLALGFSPMSLMNYKIKINGSSGGQSYTQTYSGEGGLSRINAAMTYNLLRKISIGLEYNYAFGEIKAQNYVNFNNSSYNNTIIGRETDFQKSFLKGGVVFEIGRLFNNLTLRNFSIGFVFQSGFNLNATQDGIYRSATGRDTVRLNNGFIEIPMLYSVGISNLFGKRYLVSTDAVIQNWSDYREFGNARKDFETSVRAGIGMEILPDPNSLSYFGRMTYRFGGFYDKAYYKVSDQNIYTYGFRAGANFPISKYNSIDFGINYSSKGKEGNGLIKDEFLNFTVGVNFGELWFLRPREEDQ